MWTAEVRSNTPAAAADVTSGRLVLLHPNTYGVQLRSTKVPFRILYIRPTLVLDIPESLQMPQPLEEAAGRRDSLAAVAGIVVLDHIQYNLA